MKIAKVYDNFKDFASLFRCPICKSNMGFQNGASLVCENRHCFDLSKTGYINLLQKQVKTPYSKELFESRRRVFSAGFYDKIIDKLEEIIAKHVANKEVTLLDAGCGEGFFTTQLTKDSDGKRHVFAVDIEKDAVIMAARQAPLVKCFVGDLANLPLQANAIDVILNIFSPACYEEFGRVIKGNGIVVKVVPQKNYLLELRNSAKGQLSRDEYSNVQVLALFEENMDVLEVQRVTYTLPLLESQLADFIAMTPMMFNVDKESMDLEAITEITIDVDVLVGKLRNS